MKKMISVIAAVSLMMSCGAYALADAATTATEAPAEVTADETADETAGETADDAAQTPAWAEGCSPEKPFADVDAVDFTQRIGYVYLAPNVDDEVAAGVGTLHMYVTRDDFAYAEGELTVYNSDGTVFDTVDLTTTAVYDMLDEALLYYGWGSGTELVFSMNKGFEAGAQYYVEIPEGALHFDTLAQPSGMIGKEMWSFSVEEFGIANADDVMSKLYNLTGDTLTFDVLVGGPVASAELVIENPETLTTADATEFTESGSISLECVASGDAHFTVNFYDANGDFYSALQYTGTTYETDADADAALAE